MAELERNLRQLGAEVEFPATPPLVEAVGRGLEHGGETAARPRRASRWRPLSLRTALISLAIFLALAAGVVAAVPSTRDAVLDFFDFGGATIERVPSLPEGVKVRSHPGLGARTTLGDAAGSLSFEPLLPRGLGPPGAVYVGDDPPGGELSLLYAPRPGLPRSRLTDVGLLIDEIDGSFGQGFVGKLVPRGVDIRRLRIDGRGAIWVAGMHVFYYKDHDSYSHRIGRTRLAAKTLLVQHDSTMVRIEGRFPLRKAIAIDRSLRPLGSG